MKKKLLLVLSLLILFSGANIAYSKTTNNDLANAIKMYKEGNYSECYLKLGDIVASDPSNAVAYYYLAMTSAQLGKKDEAIANYDKTLTLTSENNNLSRYAKKGKRCLETPDKCEESIFENMDEEFVLSKFGPRSSDEVRGEYEKLRIENLMREINRADEVAPAKFKEYKDFSSMNLNETPSNDEIVAALRTLQRAGLSNSLSTGYNDLSILTGNSQQNSMLNMMRSSMNPQLIQALLTSNMSQGF